MLCYRDMTFCTFHADCTSAPTCDRPLTDEVKAAARRWWGKDGAPIASYTTKPPCHESTNESHPFPDFPTGRRSVPPSHDEPGNGDSDRDPL